MHEVKSVVVAAMVAVVVVEAGETRAGRMFGDAAIIRYGGI